MVDVGISFLTFSVFTESDNGRHQLQSPSDSGEEALREEADKLQTK